MTDYGDLRVLPNSPLIDAGDNTALPTDEFDIDGDGDTTEPLPYDANGASRVANGTVDRGAFESPVIEYGSILYVDADASADGDGTSWERPLCELHTALRVAESLRTDNSSEGSIEEIWIAEGTYKPVEGYRLNTFELIDGMTLYGGFAGTETTLDERDWSAHETILSGDLGVEGDASDNAYSVVSCDTGTEAALDGFTITGAGGSIGGGISNSGTLLVRNSNIRGNSAETRGGGVLCEGGAVTIIRSTISDNDGSGIHSCQDAAICVVHSVIASNSRSGIRAYGGSFAVVNSTFLSNTADSGAGVYCTDVTSSVMTNTLFAGNRATYSGGGVYCHSGTIVFNSTTMAGNAAETGGGVYSLTSDSALTFWNSVVARNDGGDVLGVLTGDTAGNLIGVDPKFVRDPGTNGPDDCGDLRLTGRSLGIDAGSIDRIPLDTADVDHDGDTSEPLPWDLNGGTRILGESVDLGAFEFEGEAIPGRETPSTVVTTTDDVSDAYDGRVSLREAIWYAGPDPANSTITFAEELAGETFVLDGSSLVVDHGLTIDGASAGETITIDADQRSRAFTVIAPADEPVALAGLTMTGGLADFGGAVSTIGATLHITGSTLIKNAVGDCPLGNGGAVYCYRGSLFVKDSVFRWNETTYSGGSGGAIYSSYAAMNLACSIFEGNRTRGSSAGGGAIYLAQTDTKAANLVLVGNTAAYRGGGIHVNSSSLTLTNSTLVGNTSGDDGGGVHVYGSDADVTLNNSVIADNSADDTGPDVSGYLGSAPGSHNLIGDGSDQPFFVEGENGCRVGTAEAPIDPQFVRSPSDGGDGWGDDPQTFDFDESENDDFGDLRLTFFSPALDAGDPTLAVDAEGTPLEWDVLGNPRVLDGNLDTLPVVDMGAVETVPNRAPVLLPIGDKTVDEGTLLTFTVAADDRYDDPAGGVRLNARRLPAGATFDPETGVFAWTPAGDQAGTYEVVFTATDDGVPPLYASETVTITVSDIGSQLTGDLNGDGMVNTTDLDLIRGNWGSSVTPGDLLAGDPNGDGIVNGNDLDIVRANWGAMAAADAVFDSLGRAPVYGPAEREAVKAGQDVRLTPRQWEALAWENWNRERQGRSLSNQHLAPANLAWLG